MFNPNFVPSPLYEGALHKLVGYDPDGNDVEDPDERMKDSVKHFNLLSRTCGINVATVVFDKAMIDIKEASDEVNDLLKDG